MNRINKNEVISGLGDELMVQGLLFQAFCLERLAKPSFPLGGKSIDLVVVRHSDVCPKLRACPLERLEVI